MISQLFTIFSFVGSVYKTHINLYIFWQFKVITWVIKLNYFHNLNLWFCCFDHSHAEQSCASHVTVSLFFTRLVLVVSGLHLWESYVGLMPSIALLPAHSCSPSTIHSPCPPHRLLFTSLFCYCNTWSAHTHNIEAVKALVGHCCLILAERSDWMSERAKFMAA